MGFRELFFPKKRDFYGMIIDHARKTYEGLQALHAFAEHPSAEAGKKVDKLEDEADLLRKKLVYELNDSFVTPFDREDIFALAKAVDDMIDYAKTTVEEIRLFKIVPNHHLLKMTEAMSNMGELICQSLENMEKQPLLAHDLATKAKKCENYVEHRYREGLAELFESTDVMNVIKYREVYRHLSNAADRGDAAADIIQHVTVKNT